jgi:capsular polysaccharide transport system permease protein
MLNSGTKIFKNFDGLKVMIRVIKALVMRELITRYGRKNVGFLWTFFEPAFFAFLVTLVWTFVRMHERSTFPITAFIYIGYSNGLLWRNTINQCFHAINANQGLLYHSIVKPIDLVISRWLLEFLSVTGGAIALGLLFGGFGYVPFPHDLSYLLLGWILMAWFGLSMGLIFSALSVLSEVVEHFIQAFLYIFWILSGSLFAAEFLPPNVRKYFLYLPTLHIAEMVRYGLLGPIINYYYDIIYPVFFNLIALAVGFFLLKIAERKIEVE